MKVKDLMSTNITCVDEKTPVSQIAAHMRKDNVGCIPVCDGAGHLKGIVTDRDIVLRDVAARQPEKNHNDKNGPADGTSETLFSSKPLTSADIMTLNPVTVSPDMGIHDAALLLSAHQIRRLPVVEASGIVGMLSLGDIALKPVLTDEAGDVLASISITEALR